MAAVSAATRTILAAQGFQGKAKQVAVAPAAEGTGLAIFVGLGSVIDGVSATASAHLSINALRGAVYLAVEKAKALKLASVAVILPALPVSALEAVPLGTGAGIKPLPKSDSDAAAAAVPLSAPATPACGGMVLDATIRMVITGNWKWDKYWKADAAAQKNHPLTAVTIAAVTSADSACCCPFKGKTAAGLAPKLASSAAAAESLLFSREFGNERSEVLTTAAAAKVAAALAAAHPDVLKYRVLEMDELLAQGYNMITAVGQGAAVPPCIAVLEYNGFADTANAAAKGADEDFIAFVGKGVVFDTGGLNLKPTGFIESMHLDKCGAAAVIGAMRALALTRPAVKVVGVLALAENAIGSKAFKPYAILDSYIGSVQNMNTDAEGRLCLADALTFVQNEYKPTHVVNIATLTGACAIALGEHAAGLFSNSTDLSTALTAAGARHAERLWRMPILEEHHAETAGEDADYNSMGARTGGACSAAAFLEKYIQAGVQWAHLDIAGPGMGITARDWLPKNATGFGMQTLLQYALDKAAANAKL